MRIIKIEMQGVTRYFTSRGQTAAGSCSHSSRYSNHTVLCHSRKCPYWSSPPDRGFPASPEIGQNTTAPNQFKGVGTGGGEEGGEEWAHIHVVQENRVFLLQ